MRRIPPGTGGDRSLAGRFVLPESDATGRTSMSGTSRSRRLVVASAAHRLTRSPPSPGQDRGHGHSRPARPPPVPGTRRRRLPIRGVGLLHALVLLVAAVVVSWLDEARLDGPAAPSPQPIGTALGDDRADPTPAAPGAQRPLGVGRGRQGATRGGHDHRSAGAALDRALEAAASRDEPAFCYYHLGELASGSGDVSTIGWSGSSFPTGSGSGRPGWSPRTRPC
jgi:hypothetical protein